MCRSLPNFFTAAICATLLLVSGVGCKRSSRTLAPLPVSSIARELDRAFTSAPAEAQKVLPQVRSCLDNGDLAGALAGARFLALLPQSTDKQRLTATRALIGITEALHKAQANGDLAAAAALQDYLSTR